MSKKILIVDDAPDIANIFKKQLDLGGEYEAEVAYGGVEALEKISTTKFDLVLLDLVMPDKDGIEVFKEMKADEEKYHNTPVIALTNSTSPEVREETKKLGMSGFIVKTDADIDVVLSDFFKES